MEYLVVDGMGIVGASIHMVLGSMLVGPYDMVAVACWGNTVELETAVG